MKNKRGFTIVETLLATLVLVIFTAGISGLYASQMAVIKNAAHKLDAMTAAEGAIKNILTIVDFQWEDRQYTVYDPTWLWVSGDPALLPGLHDETTNPELALQPGYFRDELNGKLEYTVTREELGREVWEDEWCIAPYSYGILKVDFLISWDDASGGARKEMNMKFSASPYYIQEPIVYKE